MQGAGGQAPSSALAVTVAGSSESNTKETARTGGASDTEFVSELPQHLVVVILNMTRQSRTEFVAYRCLNRTWNAAVESLIGQLPAQIPSLILPSSADPMFHNTQACELDRLATAADERDDPDGVCDWHWHKLHLPEDVRVHGKFSGSSEGGWFALSLDEPRRHHMFNIHTRQMIAMPVTVRSGQDVSTFRFRAAVPSSSPLLPGCTVAALGEDCSSVLATWRMDTPHWEDVHLPTDWVDDFADLIYHRGEFWLLTAREKIGKLKDDHGNLWWQEFPTKERGDYLSDTHGSELLNLNINRYLVESGGILHMVIKMLRMNDGRAFTIKVYKLELNEEEDQSSNASSDDEGYSESSMYFSWEDASSSLVGRALFVGQASSRSFAAQSAKIHFFDDSGVEVEEEPGRYTRQNMGFIGIAHGMEDDVVEVWPLLGDPPHPPRSSDRCPPAWWIYT